MADLYIASCIARVRSEHIATAQAAAERILGGPVSASDGNGKFVVVLEGPSTASLLDQMDSIRNIEGVLNIEMVYQHAEDESLMKEYLE